MIEKARERARILRDVEVDECIDFPYAVHTMLQMDAILIESLSDQLEQVTRVRNAAVKDIYMLCQCDVCARLCKYDKPNPYCKCADFEWRGVEVQG